MTTFWMLVADSSRARVYEGASPVGTLTPVHELEHEIAKLHEGDLVSDRPGRRHDDGHGRSAMERDVMATETDSFAREVASFLDDHRARGDFERLSIVADPSFLGSLRKHLSAPTNACLMETVSKNVGHGSAADAQQFLTRVAP